MPAELKRQSRWFVKKVARHSPLLPTSGKEVADAFRQIAANFEQIDILINNAGVELYKDFLQFESAEWDRLLAVNLNSVYYCSKQAIPFMIRSGEGSIVNMSSVQALATTGQVSPYAAAKGGILSLTRDMAREFGKHKIRVNSICPGCIHTPMMDRTLATMPNAEVVVERMAQAIPLQRLGRAEDIAKVALFLASALLTVVPAYAQSPWEDAVNKLREAFTGSIARGLSLVAIVVGGLMFAFGEGDSKRMLAGIVFGVGMAIGALSFMAWLFP